MLLVGSQDLDWVYNLYQFGQAEALEDRSNKVFEQMLEHIVAGFSAESGSLALYLGEQGCQLTIVAAIGLPASCIGSEIPGDKGVIGWVLQHLQAVLLKGDVNDDPRFEGHIPKESGQLPVSALCWPLIVGSRLLGVLCVNSFDASVAYSEADLQAGQQLVNMITLVIDNIRLHGEQQQRIQQLAASNDRYLEANSQLQDALKRLNYSEKRRNDILNSLDSVVWSMDASTKKMLYLNQTARDMSGRPMEDFFNDPDLWLNIIDVADRGRVELALAGLTVHAPLKITCRIRRPDGELRWVFHHMSLNCDDSETPQHIDGITVDITQHKQAEELLKQRNSELQKALDTIQEVQRQLVQSEKMSSIGHLAAGVAHEINNPIGYINSNLTSLKSYVEDMLSLLDHYQVCEACCADQQVLQALQAEKQAIDLEFLKGDVLDLLNESLEGASRVRKIVQDLKDFSHAGGADEWQWANLNDCLDSTLNIVNNEIKYKARVVKEYGETPPIWCLPHQLNQVIMNLLVNAAHAIEENGVISIRTGVEGDYVWFVVADTGKGISDEHLSKIFDPFFTTKPVGKGTGLGLSVSYNIIQKHRGEIRVTSRLGEGTAFRVLIPNKVEVPQT